MRIWVLVICLAAPAHAAPVTPVCNGSLTADSKTVPVDWKTAILDLEKRTFRPPLYPEFPITRFGENDVSFGLESTGYPAWGSLDRVSGSLAMNVLKPEERKKLQARRFFPIEPVDTIDPGWLALAPQDKQPAVAEPPAFIRKLTEPGAECRV